jgi:hypothetical protein
MVQLIEGTHYKRRHDQPTPVPHKSKEAVDYLLEMEIEIYTLQKGGLRTNYLLCSDPGVDDDAQLQHVARKRSRPIGQNIRLDRFKRLLRSHHPAACRNGARSLFAMGFTRWALGVYKRRRPLVSKIFKVVDMLKKFSFMQVKKA